MVAAVTVRDISKRYRVQRAANGQLYGYRTLRDDLAHLARWPMRLLRGQNRVVHDDFWALHGVEFTIGRGEVVGIIGHNGAGKSTLLKILSRITKPTSGSILLRGRVGSLLEVGTGFHPELTGRENLFLNGAILGMRRREILSKFDAIVDFAEIGPFLDTPVKRYSSGMYVRLAFAIAAHLEPEILIVDEVLAVGDMAFQRKCMGRMKEVGRSGATVLFVSHSMPAIESLCTRAILIDHGKVARDGEVKECVTEYYRKVLQGDGDGQVSLEDIESPARRVKAFRSAAILDDEGRPVNFVPMAGKFHLRLHIDCARAVNFPTVTIGIDDNMGQRLLNLVTPATRPVIERLHGTGTLDCIVERFPLAPGDYWIKLGLGTLDDEIDDVERALRFTVTECDAFGEGHERHRGIAVTPSQWTFSLRSE
jgi:lipopolysaccharide transport system ATP-binding protein